jgi:hypothetical protein
MFYLCFLLRFFRGRVFFEIFLFFQIYFFAAISRYFHISLQPALLRRYQIFHSCHATATSSPRASARCRLQRQAAEPPCRHYFATPRLFSLRHCFTPLFSHALRAMPPLPPFTLIFTPLLFSRLLSLFTLCADFFDLRLLPIFLHFATLMSYAVYAAAAYAATPLMPFHAFRRH